MKTKYYILSLCTAAAAFFSCTDASSLLDREDVGTLYESDVFRNPAYARYFVNDIYYHLPGADWTPGTGYQPKSTWYGAYLECATDNAEARRLDSDAQHFNEGNWNAESRYAPATSSWRITSRSPRSPESPVRRRSSTCADR